MTLSRLFARVPITRRSGAVDGSLLRLVDAAGATRIEHVLTVPRGACPVSRNPLGGTLTLSYEPAGRALEVVSLHDALAWACGPAKGSPTSAEGLALWAAKTAAAALGVPVTARLVLLLRPGNQTLTVESEGRP